MTSIPKPSRSSDDDGGIGSYGRFDRIIELLTEIRTIGLLGGKDQAKLEQAISEVSDILIENGYQANVTGNGVKGLTSAIAAMAEAITKIAEVIERIDKRTGKELRAAVIALIVAVGGSSVLTAAMPLIKAALGIGG